jgi:K+-sensing histidine kinase KdpD
MPDTASQNRTDSLNLPWSDTVRFIRQLNHDLRNHLNAIELQSAYIVELGANEELKGEIARLREMISALTSTLQKISGGVSEVKPTLISYPAAEFIEDLRNKIAREFPEKSAEITWQAQPVEAVLNIDPQFLQEAFIELFANAFQHDRGNGALGLDATIDNDRFVFTLREPKSRFELSTENWGRQPLRTMSRGRYGLGLHRVRAIVEAHGGEMHAQYDPNDSILVTTVALPLSGKES